MFLLLAGTAWAETAPSVPGLAARQADGTAAAWEPPRLESLVATWSPPFAERLTARGKVEFEGSYQRRTNPGAPTTTDKDLNLAKAELFLVGDLYQHAKGFLHFKYKNGYRGARLDEGYLLWGQDKEIPYYLMAGRIYPAIGLFQTSFITDPVTQQAFETQQTAFEVGYQGSWLSLGLGGYRSKVNEIDEGGPKALGSYYSRLSLAMPKDIWGGLQLKGGLAYTNNLAGSKFLTEQISGGRVRELVSGWSSLLAVEYGSLYFFAEYIAADRSFVPGELSYAPASVQPRPWGSHLELGFKPFKAWTFALRHEAGGDFYAEQPQRQVGLAVAWAFMPRTKLTLEYLDGHFQNDDDRQMVTSQLAVEF